MQTAKEFDFSPFSHRLTRIVLGETVRFIPQHGKSLRPLISLSIYEAYLSQRHSSHNAVYTALNKCLYLWEWADRTNINLDVIFLQGETLEPRQVNVFGAWLKHRGSKRTGGRIDPSVINSVLGHISTAIRWFSDQYVSFDYRASEREINLQIYKNAIKARFADQRVKERKKSIANDLTEGEIINIEKFLKPVNRLKKSPKLSPAQVQRDYLIWRLMIEFGLREGEVLALRLEDCPHRRHDNISIVRIEERGSDYVDPRGAYAPRPKTLSRKLGFILVNSPIPGLITDYVTKYRRRKVVKHGRKVFQPILDKPAFLMLSHHHDRGNPLSLSSLLDVAGAIREGSGVEHFHWHLARHAFFNRAYGAIIDLKENDNELYRDRLRDLVYWGGWQNEQSLQLYINRARSERAQTALRFYQSKGSEWNALK